ncbi:MAG TPA: MFS transporter, partial [Thermopolyspora sp.]
EPILPPRLFRDRTFVLAGTASLLVGVAMFGAMIYLPQYLQIVKGMSPTGSGLMTLPMVLGLFVSSVISGRIVTRTGRWKAFPLAGLLLVAIGLALLSRLDIGSGIPVIGVDVAVLGIGLGMTMQILILAAQNAVHTRDMAVSTSGISFFRSLGGAVGVAAFGAILTNGVKHRLMDMLAAAHVQAPAGGVSLGTPDAIHHLPPVIRQMVIEAFADAMQTVFLVAVPTALLGFVAVLGLRELRLRTHTDQVQSETATA